MKYPYYRILRSPEPNLTKTCLINLELWPCLFLNMWNSYIWCMNWEKYFLIWDEQCPSIWYLLLTKLWFVFKLEMVCFSRKYDLTSFHTKVALMYTFSQNLCANKELIILGCNFACMTFLLNCLCEMFPNQRQCTVIFFF